MIICSIASCFHSRQAKGPRADVGRSWAVHDCARANCGPRGPSTFCLQGFRAPPVTPPCSNPCSCFIYQLDWCTIVRGVIYVIERAVLRNDMQRCTAIEVCSRVFCRPSRTVFGGRHVCVCVQCMRACVCACVRACLRETKRKREGSMT